MLTSDQAGLWAITYYNARVQREIFSLPPPIRADYWRLKETMRAHGPNLRMPHSRALGDGLFELRPHGKDGIGRVFYCSRVGRRIVILHTFVKKTQRTPDSELRVARSRMKEVQRNG
jgi:phage-related protein